MTLARYRSILAAVFLLLTSARPWPQRSTTTPSRCCLRGLILG